MSSTLNVQNLLSNVFRPTFVYSVVAGNYQTKLELINIDTVSANTVSTYAVKVVDSNSNAYIGSGAGNANSTMTSSSNFSNTFVGTNAGAGSQNVLNGVLIGSSAANVGGGTGSISIGANTLNGGSSNIYIGYATGVSAGSNNIFIGPGIGSNVAPSGSSTSNTLLIGSGARATLISDLVNHRVGINMASLPATAPSNVVLDVNGYARIGDPNNPDSNGGGGLGINRLPGNFTLDVNGTMRVTDGGAVLTFNNFLATISNEPSYPNSNATLQVTGGFFSATGLETNPPTPASVPLKKGLFTVTAIVGSSFHTYTGVASSTSSQTRVSQFSNIDSNGTFITSNSSSVIVDGSANWSVTYFPSP
jgi:hypothetical protein